MAKGSSLIARALLVTVAIGCGREMRSDCRPTSAVAYWSHTVAFEVVDKDADGRRSWARADRPTEYCFSAPLSEVNDPLTRTEGLVLGIRELAKELTTDESQWNTDSSTLEARRKLRNLVGRDFSSAREYEGWLIENADYLRWSDQAHALVIDEQARIARRPVVPPHVTELSAADYWYYEGMQWLQDVRTEGDFVRGSFWGGGEGAGHVQFRVAKSALDDRAAKEAGYRRAVEMRLQFFQGASPDGEQEIVRHLARLTGQGFRDATSWKAWWTQNRGSLRLSEDGSRLEVRLSE